MLATLLLACCAATEPRHRRRCGMRGKKVARRARVCLCPRVSVGMLCLCACVSVGVLCVCLCACVSVGVLCVCV